MIHVGHRSRPYGLGMMDRIEKREEMVGVFRKEKFELLGLSEK